MKTLSLVLLAGALGGCAWLVGPEPADDSETLAEQSATLRPHTHTFYLTRNGQDGVEARIDKPNLLAYHAWTVGRREVDFDLYPSTIDEEILIAAAKKYFKTLSIGYQDTRKNRIHAVVLNFDQGVVGVVPADGKSWWKPIFVVLDPDSATPHFKAGVDFD